MDTSETTTTAPAVRWWLPVTTLVLVAAGLAVSAYLTVVHLTSPALLLCSATSVINCETVTTSPESHVFGIPVAVLGVVYFVAMAGLVTPVAWRSPSGIVRWARLVGAGAGVLFVVYLVSAELVLIGKICLWCTAVHVLTVALASVIVAGELGWGSTPRPEMRMGAR